MKKIIKIIIAVGAVIVIGVVLLGNSSSSKSLKLGLMLPLSGDFAVAGQNYQKGVELALEQYKKKNPNASIDLIVEDDGFDPKKGVSAYRKLKDLDKVDAIMMLSTPVIDAIHEDVKEAGIPVMQLGIQTVGISDDNIFQMSPSPEAPIADYARYLSQNNPFSKVAVMYDNSSGGISFYNAFKSGYEGKFDSMVVNSKDDLRNYATRIANENYESVVILTSPVNGALAAKEILAVDSTPPFFAFDAQIQTGFADYEKILGDMNRLNGAHTIWLKSGNTEKFRADYKAKYNEEPGFIADFGYDIFNTLIDSYADTNTEWVSNIKEVDTAGVSGPISFDDKGVRIQPIVINKIEGGKIVPIE